MRDHAVVIGAGMAGLLAARALSDAFERVTVIDRDALPDAPEPRRAVPQGRHAHALLPHGHACLERLFEGLCGELAADGAASAAALEETRLVIGGHELARVSTGRRALYASRPFFEHHVRRRVRALPGVALLDRVDVAGLTATADRARVTGVRILRRADGSVEETLPADLVVAATGRAARVPAWLAGLGYERPAEQRLEVGVTYASRHLRLPPDALGGDRMVLFGAVPGRPRTLFLFPQEDERWILTLAGYGAEHRPPEDPDAFVTFAATVGSPDVLEAIRAAEPLDDVTSHGFAVSVRRRYDRLRRFPEGLLACGDALCAFNPTYGQGMTVAAAQAVALQACLQAGDRDLAQRFFRKAAEPVQDAWQLAAGADLALPEVKAPRPPRVRALNAYMNRLRAVAERDIVVADALSAVIGMQERPSKLVAPAIARRVVRGARLAPRQVPRLQVGGVTTPLRQVGPADASEAVVFVHGNPGASADWEPLLAAVGGERRALAWDAPGFGGAKAPGFEQTVERHAEFIGQALDELGVERAHLVLHDFGGPWGLRWAAANPERFASAVLLNTGSLPGYSWHALARLWRTPGAGELFMATTTRSGFRTLLRRGQPRPLPRPFVDRMFDDFDRETRRAVLELYRSVPDPGAAGTELASALRPFDRPALVLWGRHDPYIGVEQAERERRAFPSAEIRVLDDAGHWPFVDAPALVADAVERFLAAQVVDSVGV